MVKLLKYEISDDFKVLNSAFEKKIQTDSLYEMCIQNFFKHSKSWWSDSMSWKPVIMDWG